jgi:hypothetical protein
VGGYKEVGIRVLSKLMAQDPEGSGGISKGAGNFLRRATLDKIGSHCFILALL